MIPLMTRLECDAGRSGSTAVSVTCPIINCAFEPAKTSLKGRQSDASSTANGVFKSALKWCVSVHTAQSREMLHGRTDVERVEATHISQSNIDYRGRVA